MSKVVDQRVVEMQFDNKQFEQNVATTMSTLDKLKQKLNMSGASKGLDDVGRAARNVNMSGLSAGVEAVTAKFSAMQVMGVTALANITNSAVNAGKRIVDSLTIEPIRTGFNEYELKMDSVRTILASTGESVEKVNKYLEELNEYSDQTIYSFSDMTQNIGKFTNAGVKLEDAVMAIKGISNEAAVSGANANEASRAMYNFAQALSAGHVKLIDWKSIELANMATKEFKEQLIGSAVAAGTLTKDADGMYRTLKGNVLSSTKNFNETLSDQWMTTEVLINTLKNYADNTTDIGKKAFAAAQDVTKFTQMLDVLKETAQSGWAKTWELLFGDINQAKAIFTPLTEFFSTLINGVSDFRNNLLEGALASPFVKLAEKITNVTDSVSGAVEVMQDYDAIVDQILNGDFGNGQARWDALTEAGYDWAHAQNLVNERLGDSTRHATTFAEAQSEVNAVQERTLDQLAKMSDSQLKEIGYTDEQISALRELAAAASDAGLTISAFLDEVSKTDGRTLIIESLKNAGSGLIGVFTALKEAWIDIFPPMTSLQLYNLIAGFNKFTEHLRLTDKETGELTDTAKKLQRVFRGVFAAIDIITTIVGGGLKIAFKAVTQLLGMFDMDILSVAANIGDAIVGFRDWIDSVLDFTKVFEAIIPVIEKAAGVIKDWYASVRDSEVMQDFFQGIIDGFKHGVKKVWNAIVSFGTKLVETFAASIGVQSPSWMAFDIAVDFVQGFVNGLLTAVEWIISAIGKLGSTIVDAFRTFDFKSIVSHIQDIFSGVTKYVTKFMKGIGKFFANVDFGTIVATGISSAMVFALFKIGKALSAFTGTIEGVNDVIEGAASVVKSFSGVLKSVSLNLKVKALKELAVAIAILVGAVAVLTFLDPDRTKEALSVVLILAAIIAALGFALSKMGSVANGIGQMVSGLANIAKISALVLAVSTALLMIAGVVKMMAGTEPTDLLKLAAVATGFGVLVGTLLYVNNKYPSRHLSKLGSMILKIGAAMLLIAWVAKIASKMDNDALIQAGKGLTGLLAFVGGIGLIGIIAGKRTKQLGSAMMGIAGAMLIMAMVVKMVGSMDQNTLAQGNVAIVAFSLIVGMLVAITNLAPPNELKNVGRTILGIGLAIMALALTAKLLGGMDPTELNTGIQAITVLMVIVSILVMVTNLAPEHELKRIGSTILMLSVAVGILAGIAVVLSLVNVEALSKGVIAVGFISLMLAGMIAATKNATDCKWNLILITAAIAVLVTSVAVLSTIDPTRLVTASVALGVLMGIFTLITQHAGTVSGSIPTLVVMTLAVGMIGYVLYKLAEHEWQSLLGAGAALTAVLISLSIAMMVCSAMGPVATTALLAIGVLTLVAGALGFILIKLRELDPVQAIQIVGVITAFLLAMELVCVAAAGVGALASLAIPGLTILVAFIGALGLVVIGLAALAMDVIAGMPKLGQDLSDFMTNVQGFVDGVQNIPDDISDKIGKLSGAILKLTGAEFVKNIADFLSGGSNIADLGAELKSFGDDIDSFAKNAKQIDSAVNSLSKLTDITDVIEDIDLAGLSGFGESLSTKIAAMLDSIVEAVNSRNAEFAEAGKKSIEAFSKGIESAQSMATNTVRMVTTKAATYVRSSYQTFYNAGSYLVDGLVDGISANSYKAEAQAAAMAKAAARAAEEALDINSPSKVFRAIGTSVPEGFAMGIDKLRNVVVASAVDMANAPLDSVREAIAGISTAISSDMDAQPTIRPVLDLSDVESGASAISGLFSSPVGTLATAGSINAMMDRRIQNGTNDEVVSALDKMSKKLDNVGNTYNSINGLTYSGDADLDNAFKTIVRAAKIERRV